MTDLTRRLADHGIRPQDARTLSGEHIGATMVAPVENQPSNGARGIESQYEYSHFTGHVHRIVHRPDRMVSVHLTLLGTDHEEPLLFAENETVHVGPADAFLNMTWGAISAAQKGDMR